jgi:hypothetical protein
MQRQKRDLAIMLVLTILAMIFGGVFGHPDSRVPMALATPLMITDLLLLQYLLYRVTAGYAKTRSFKIFYASLLVFQFALNAYVNRPGVTLSGFIGTATLTYTLSLLAFCIVFYFIIQDMFAKRHDITYSLLAASNAYFLIAETFGYLYSIIAVHNPMLLGFENVSGMALVQRTFEVSHFVVAGYDIPDYVAPIFKSFTVIEAFTANLFIIFVVGRLMATEINPFLSKQQ